MWWRENDKKLHRPGGQSKTKWFLPLSFFYLSAIDYENIFLGRPKQISRSRNRKIGWKMSTNSLAINLTLAICRREVFLTQRYIRKYKPFLCLFPLARLLLFLPFKSFILNVWREKPFVRNFKLISVFRGGPIISTSTHTHKERIPLNGIRKIARMKTKDPA